jgi:transcriptional regulator with XRE-family HTH domain
VRPSDFRRWRKSLQLSQKQAAEALGLKRRMVQYYEKGERDGEKVAVPKAVRLACSALAAGVADYHGPDTLPEQVRAPDRVNATDEPAGSNSDDPRKDRGRSKRTR